MGEKKILKKGLCLVSLLLMGCASLPAQEQVPIIPKPFQVEQNTGCFTLTDKSVISYDEGLKDQAEYLQQLLRRSTGWNLRMVQGKKKNGIRLTSESLGHDEAYRLEVSPKGVVVTGNDNGGVFYGIQSLLQLFPAEVYSSSYQCDVDWKVPAVVINDAPERPWRGMMLDVARYFHSVDFVKKYIDMMAMYKLNKLQLHLVDDSGWRLEIKKYPRLTEVGAWAGTNTNRLGGFYTQEEMKELIAYAKLRNVEIIPEIEFPAHVLSAVVAYPWLSCTGEQHELPMQHFISRDLLCVGKETTYQFLEDVLEETAALFPSAYINIGGDEAVYTRWDECPKCQALMKREGLKKTSELQGYLTNVVSDMMKKKDRTIIGWEEIIQRGKLNNPVVALFWHNVGDTIQATHNGHKAILTPATNMYFDFPESNTPGEIKAATWMPPISVEKCYSMDINDYSPSSTVLGVFGCLWSDQFIHGTILQELPLLDENRSEHYVEYLTFPRLLALSEVAWCNNAHRDYKDFSNRLSSQFNRLDNKDCHYRVPEPEIVSMEKNAAGNYVFTLKPSVEGAKILYTTDGSYPHNHSALYTAPVEVKNKSDFHAITFVTDGHYSLPIYFAPDYSAYAKYGTFTTEWKPLQMQTRMSPWKFECTGKVSGNGTYEVSFIRTNGENNLQLGKLELLKRDEKLAEVDQNFTLSASSAVATYRFEVKEFEAGTPFFINVQAAGQNGNDTNGLVFIRKVE